MAGSSMLEAVKIQARAVIPIVKALEAEIGRERAHALVGEALAESWAAFVASRTSARDEHPGAGEGDAGSGFAFPVEATVVDTGEDHHAVDMTACQFARWFREIGEPEIGALLTCGVDYAVERQLRPGWEFRRSQTQMEGAPHCDFRWRRR